MARNINSYRANLISKVVGRGNRARNANASARTAAEVARLARNDEDKQADKLARKRETDRKRRATAKAKKDASDSSTTRLDVAA
jgi:hypothetical protein